MLENLDIHNPIYAQLILSAALGALIGLERELAGKDASLRTFMIISLGSCLFTVCSVLIATTSQSDPGRIAAQVVTGIGFLGAGAIFKSNFGIEGLTTAALIWLTAGIGMLCGLGHYQLSIGAAIIAIGFMLLLNFVHAVIRRIRPDYYTDSDEL